MTPEPSDGLRQGQRILHVAATSVPHTNGYTMRLQSIVREQLARGLQPTVITSPFYPGRLVPAGGGCFDDITHLRCQHSAETGAGGLLGLMTRSLRRMQRLPAPLRAVAAGATLAEERLLLRQFAAAIRAAAVACRAQLIHAHTPYRCALPALQVARQLRLPLVYEVRGIWEDTAVADGDISEGSLAYRYVRSRENIAFAGADAVVAICETLKAEVCGRGAPPGRTFVAPNGADFTRLAAAPSAAGLAAGALRAQFLGRPVLGYVGSVRPLEGIDALIKAVAELRRRGQAVAGLVVGTGPSIPELKHLAEQLGVGDAVVFAGHIPATHVGAYYDLIDVFVVSRDRSRVTNLVTPIKPLEAMARGKAVVMSGLPSLRELGESAAAARWFEPGNINELADCAAALLANPSECAALGERARSWVQRERTWSRSFDSTLAAYAAAAHYAATRR